MRYAIALALLLIPFVARAQNIENSGAMTMVPMNDASQHTSGAMTMVPMNDASMHVSGQMVYVVLQAVTATTPSRGYIFGENVPLPPFDGDRCKRAV